MNNKPVAWMCQDNVTDEWEFSSMKHCHKCEPLYTNPVKKLTINITEIKRTSDQSIQIVFTSCRSASEFVEILRKSQEQ